MSYQKYKGKDKYHFRYYRKSNYHPFLVIMVTEEFNKDGKIYISGFNITHSYIMYNKRKSDFIHLLKNPNSLDDSESYLNKTLITKESKLFTEPIKKWHLSKKDELRIDRLVDKIKKSL